MDKMKLFFEDGSYIFTKSMTTGISKDNLSNKNLERGLYLIPQTAFDDINYPLYYEELEWYEVDSENILHFLGYATDSDIIEKVCRY